MKNKLLFITLFVFNFISAKNGIEIIETTQENWGKVAKKYFSYLKGSLDYMSGNFDGAIAEFEKIKKTENSVFFYDRFIRFLFLTNQFEKIINLDKRIKNAFKNNLDIQKIFAQSYFNLGKNAQVDLFLDKLTKKYPQDTQLPYLKVVNYIKRNLLDKALKYIEECLNNPYLQEKRFLFLFLKSKIFLQKNEYQKSLKSINKCIKEYPNFEKGWLVKALLEEQLGKIQQAISGYKRFLDIVGKDEPVERQVIRLLFTEKKFSEAVKMLEKIKNKTPSQNFTFALIKWKLNKPQDALKILEKLISNSPEFKQAKYLKIEILVSTGKKKQALDLLQSWLLKKPDDVEMLKLLLLLKRSGIRVNQIINIIHQIEKIHQNEFIYFALIDTYFEKLNYKKVLFYCKKLFSIVKNPAIKSKILFQTAYIHFVKGNKSKVEKILLTALQYEPVYTSVHNLLAYFYAKNNKNLQKALSHATLAVTIDPRCYYYLDTKGYVLFKMGKIKESIEFFQKALQFNPNDEEVLKHLNLAKNFGK